MWLVQIVMYCEYKNTHLDFEDIVQKNTKIIHIIENSILDIMD